MSQFHRSLENGKSDQYVRLPDSEREREPGPELLRPAEPEPEEHLRRAEPRIRHRSVPEHSKWQPGHSRSPEHRPVGRPEPEHSKSVPVHIGPEHSSWPGRSRCLPERSSGSCGASS